MKPIKRVCRPRPIRDEPQLAAPIPQKRKRPTKSDSSASDAADKQRMLRVMLRPVDPSTTDSDGELLCVVNSEAAVEVALSNLKEGKAAGTVPLYRNENSENLTELKGREEPNGDEPGGNASRANTEPPLTELTLEERRERNIRANADFLAQLRIAEVKSSMGIQTRRPKPSTRGLQRKPAVKQPHSMVPERRSERIQGKEATEAADLNTLDKLDKLVEKKQPQYEYSRDRKSASLSLSESCINLKEGEPLQLVTGSWAPLDTEEKTRWDMDGERFRESLSALTLREEDVSKVTRSRITAIAVHPQEDQPPLLAAGDKVGFVGVWNTASKAGDDGVFTFHLHGDGVSCMHIRPEAPTALMTSSYDGTIRLTDLTSTTSNEVFHLEDPHTRIYAFDYLSPTSAVLTRSDGMIQMIDIRADNRYTGGSEYRVARKNVKTVSVHPVQPSQFVVSAFDTVAIYDSRCIKAAKWDEVATPLGSFDCPRVLQSVAFSAVTGSRVVGVCMDNTVRVWDSSNLSQLTETTKLKHDNFTGRWLTPLRAVAHPRFDDAFVLGSIGYPRHIDVFHTSGALLRSVTADNLTTICSISALHPTRNILVSGNSSGKLHVFSDL